METKEQIAEAFYAGKITAKEAFQRMCEALHGPQAWPKPEDDRPEHDEPTEP